MQVATIFQDTKANLAAWAPTLPPQWMGFETDTARWKRGDGVTAWPNLPYLKGGGFEIIKPINEDKTSDNTLAADTHLQFAAAANTKYRIKMKIWFDTGATPDFKYQISGPATPTAVRIFRKHIDPTNKTTLVVASETDYTSSTSLAAGTGTTGGYIEVDMILHNGSTAGTVSFDWSQATSNSTATTVLAGSSLTYEII